MSEIDTPAMLIDLDLVKENIQRCQAYADKHGLKLRPHIKTHKLPLIAKMQLDAGARGINCQKVSEAEAMVEGLGPDMCLDVLITFSIVGRLKLRRLMRLLGKCEKLCVVADSAYTIDGLAKAWREASRADTGGKPLYVKIECDTGGLRAGVVEPAQALALAQHVVASGLRFDGLMTYPAHDPGVQLSDWLNSASKLFEAAGLELPEVSVGGTPDMWEMHTIKEKLHAPGMSFEMRPGTYVYNDRAILHSGAAQLEWCAQTVVSTVVSQPTPLRAVCDAGSKTLSSDLLMLTGFGYIREFPKAKLTRISEEHGVIEAERPEDLPPIGAVISIVPNHACPVSNLFSDALISEGGEMYTVPIIARGKTQ